jgi:hypothetical protein
MAVMCLKHQNSKKSQNTNTNQILEVNDHTQHTQAQAKARHEALRSIFKYNHSLLMKSFALIILLLHNASVSILKVFSFNLSMSIM